MLWHLSLRSAMKLQTINRVHRIGQTRATYVHKVMIRDTVEERIYAIQQAEYVAALAA